MGSSSSAQGELQTRGRNVNASCRQERQKRKLRLLMTQHMIKLWDPHTLLHERLERQQRLFRLSPLRFVPAAECLAYLRSRAGGRDGPVSKLRFCQWCLELFEDRGSRCPSWEVAKVFYEIFDMVNYKCSETPPLSELVCGLISYLTGSAEERASTILDFLMNDADGRVSRCSISDLIAPVVWYIVPPHASVLRPMVLADITDEAMARVGTLRNESVSRKEFVNWIRDGVRAGGPEIVFHAVDCMVVSSMTRNLKSVRAAEYPESRMEPRAAGVQKRVQINNAPTLLGQLSCWSPSTDCRSRSDTCDTHVSIEEPLSAHAQVPVSPPKPSTTRSKNPAAKRRLRSQQPSSDETRNDVASSSSSPATEFDRSIRSHREMYADVVAARSTDRCTEQQSSLQCSRTHVRQKHNRRMRKSSSWPRTSEDDGMCLSARETRKQHMCATLFGGLTSADEHRTRDGRARDVDPKEKRASTDQYALCRTARDVAQLRAPDNRPSSFRSEFASSLPYRASELQLGGIYM
eukprot:TRINITY_DN15477_c0_g4_i2.p1 TRINITY_DN15477_c0_g4~~TRINITY_DN15477_c0_g4_i2.p1  ORF type:complete len:520 (+),score=47.54 TRINITY_DN15477_c0_g4_i2:45-1604(+)